MDNRDDNHWAIEAVRIAPAEHKSTLAWILLAIIVLIFVGAWAGGAHGAHHEEE